MNAKPAEHHGPYLVVRDTNDAPRSAIMSVRIKPELRSEIDRATKHGPYQISITALIERGIVLAIRELDELAKRIK